LLKLIYDKHMKTASAKLNRRAERGATLVEVLVTVVIVSVGLLGVVALQAVSLRNNYSSFLRGQATVLASDIVDRIRANRDNAPSYAVAFGATLPATSTHGRDVTDWKNTIQTVLPATPTGTQADGEVSITQLSVGRFQVIVRIQWGEREESSALQFETRTEV
jgi:type IV pilus assembly protein PilV